MVYETFSKRQKAEKGKSSEIYLYNEIPATLRTQIVHIWHAAFGDEQDYYATTGAGVRSTYEYLVKIIREEVGVFILPSSKRCTPVTFLDELIDYFLHEKDVEKILDVIQLSFQFIDKFVRSFQYQFRQNFNEIADQFIEDLNTRFKEHSVGYRFENQQLIQIDSEFLHKEVIKPVLKLLNKSEYAGAQNEFLNACEHYKYGRKKEVLNDCLKAFESTMKSICDKRGWEHPSNATASSLITICLANKLLPPFFQSKLESLKSLFESGIPMSRNKLGGHGQGSEVVEVPNSIAAFALHETATILVLFDQADTELL